MFFGPFLTTWHAVCIAICNRFVTCYVKKVKKCCIFEWFWVFRCVAMISSYHVIIFLSTYDGNGDVDSIYILSIVTLLYCHHFVIISYQVIILISFHLCYLLLVICVILFSSCLLTHHFFKALTTSLHVMVLVFCYRHLPSFV